MIDLATDRRQDWLRHAEPRVARRVTGLPVARMLAIGFWVFVAIAAGPAAIVFWRRLEGSITQPLPPFMLVVCGLVLAGVGLLGQQCLYLGTPRRNRLLAQRLLIGALLAAAAVLSLPGSPWPALLLFWGLTALPVLSLLGWQSFRPRPELAGSRAPSAIDYADESGDMLVWQHLQRSRSPAGDDLLEGWARLEFGPGESLQVIHLAFCPPFRGIPRLETEQSDGPEARLKTTQLLPYGARIEVKLGQGAKQREEVVIVISAYEQPVAAPSPSTAITCEVS